MVGFSQKNYSWFKVNNSYFERTGFKIKDIKNKEKEFNDGENKILYSDKNNIFLYGKLWVNTSNVKILCPPDSIKIDKKGKRIPIDISEGEVKQKCIKFQAGDLENMQGLLPVKD